jgi:hypothetical protein
MGGWQIVLVLTAVFSVLNTEIFRLEAKTKRLFHCVRNSIIISVVLVIL